jgi:serine/threonine protein kinase
MPISRSPADGGLQAGDRLGPYRLLTLLGQGRMGIVFRALRETDGESVALKILRDELAGDELYRRRFQREARIASELSHAHVVPVVDFGQASGRLYIAALYVRASLSPSESPRKGHFRSRRHSAWSATSPGLSRRFTPGVSFTVTSSRPT